MLISKDHGDPWKGKTTKVQKTERAERRKKVCFLEYYEVYTVVSQNTVFSWMFKTKYA